MKIGMDQEVLALVESSGSMTPELRVALETHHQLDEGHPEWPGLWEALRVSQGEAWDEWGYIETSMSPEGDWLHRFKDHCGGHLEISAGKGYEPRQKN